MPGSASGGVRGLLEEVKRRILAHPKAYDQSDFCGMECCIGGHIDIILNGEAAHMARLEGQEYWMAGQEVAAIAMRAVGETRKPWLFRDSSDWPEALERDYDNALMEKDELARAAVGCKAIDRYLEQRGL